MRTGFKLAMAILVGFSGLATALPAGATLTCDLRTAGSSCTIAGAIYRDVTTSPTGSGVIDPFVRISSASNPVVAGYNTSFRPLNADNFESQVNSSPTFTRDLLLTSVPIVTIGGVQYREFLLDINQQNANPLLSLDGVKIFLSNTASAQATTDPAATGGGAGLGTLIYSLDGATNDNGVLLNYSLNSGSGQGDMFLDVPNSLFLAGFTNVYFWSQFGGETSGLAGNPCGSGACVNNDGFEEWAVQTPGPAVPEPATMFLGGTGLILFGYVARKRLFGGRQRATAI